MTQSGVKFWPVVLALSILQLCSI